MNDTHFPNTDNFEPTSLLRRKNANIELKNIAIRWSQLLTDPATSDSFSSVAILDGVSLASSNDACSICKDEHGHGSCQGWCLFALRKATFSNLDLSNF